jgi:integrase
MARALNKLTTRKVSSLKEPGRHSDGGGLYLRITPNGGRSWQFMTAVGGKRVEIGLGAESAIGLGAVRKLAVKMREAVALGQDPRKVLEPPVAAKRVPTFKEFADDYISSVEAGWKNPTHRKQWRNSLDQHAKAISDAKVDEVTTDDVLRILHPIWLSVPETASRVRARIERILDAAKARGHLRRDYANPARLKGHLDHLLPRQRGMTRGHHKALPYKDAAKFMEELRQRKAPAARCLEFTILTAARSGEALGTTWQEIDFDQRLWRVPEARMKAGVEHVVPLSDAAVAILEALKPVEPNSAGKVFAVDGAARSNMAMAMLLRRMGYAITTHGFRSTFRDWAGDCTNYPREIVEAALAHTLQNKAEKAYRRGTAVERRRMLMGEWAKYLDAKPHSLGAD